MSYTGSYTVEASRPMTVHVTPEGGVLMLPRSMPLILAPEAAREVAHLILAAADGAEAGVRP
jgi:hypothetical protein